MQMQPMLVNQLELQGMTSDRIYEQERPLSVEITKSVLRDFLTNDRNDVLALTGAWGVGKTFAWRQALMANKDYIKLTQYCYVSLFGINTMSELRMAIFVKSVAVKTLGAKLDFGTVNKDWAALGTNLFRRTSSHLGSFLKTVPHGSSVSVGLEALAPHFVRNTLICFDDFERQTALKPEDILGLISELKEEKGCKIALIFNAEKLEEKEAYRVYKEKVIDYEVLYAPTVNEAFDLVFETGFPNRGQVLRHVVDLGITNVRILRKVQQVITRIAEATGGMHVGVLEASIATAVLLCWVAYAPDAAKPKIEEIETWNKALISFKKEAEEDPVVLAWVKRLHAYGFIHVDDLDLAIARIVERGYVDGTGYIEVAKTLDADIRGKEACEPFTAVWRRYRDSFSDDQDVFIADLHGTTLQAINNIGSGDLNGTVVLLRQLKRDDLADDLIAKYVDAHKAKPATFDLAAHPFGGSINDPKLRAIFDSVHAGLVQLPSLAESLSFMARTSSYNPEHLDAMKRASVDDYQTLFLAPHDDDKLSNLIKWSMRWAETDHAEITEKAKEALERIKAMSLLNSIRVGRYGV